MAGVALYASLFDPQIARLHLMDLPATHRDGPIFLNVLRYLDMPQAVALAAEHTSIVFGGRNTSVRQFATSVAENLGWDRQRLSPHRDTPDRDSLRVGADTPINPGDALAHAGPDSPPSGRRKGLSPKLTVTTTPLAKCVCCTLRSAVRKRWSVISA